MTSLALNNSTTWNAEFKLSIRFDQLSLNDDDSKINEKGPGVAR